MSGEGFDAAAFFDLEVFLNILNILNTFQRPIVLFWQDDRASRHLATRERREKKKIYLERVRRPTTWAASRKRARCRSQLKLLPSKASGFALGKISALRCSSVPVWRRGYLGDSVEVVRTCMKTGGIYQTPPLRAKEQQKQPPQSLPSVPREALFGPPRGCPGRPSDPL